MTNLSARLAPLALASTLLMSLGGCGGSVETSDTKPATTGPASSEPADSATSPPSSSSSAASEGSDLGDDADAMADALQAAIPTLKTRLKMTEDNDANELFGRPGKYDQVTFLADTRLGCKAAGDFDGLSTDCGVKIERWPSAEAARARAEEIQRKLRDFGLGAEYDYLVGRLIVRVAGDLKPSQAKRIQAAAAAGDPVRPQG